ncbi:acetate--CoA ligase family protein [Albidovulum sediminis]|uniref:Acetate--CoA ligase family protein n=1 Tax=Albidovulum sediminis TaxID=3066345 RepID=A0ABT2NH29_9RHOB|nr:acetate--CoA ligase family protein [Defluviimonas sediminis]MCT8328209.1 acetate--CoA ligase family protein [Defluviimonas sediminis]
MTPARRANLTRLLSPRHIAFVGGRDAEVAIGEAERRGFRGAIWAVNPRRDALGGHPCFRSLADLPEAPDAVFLAVPAPAAVEAVAELARMGAGGIVCYTAGFREAGATGAELERRLIEATGDMALIGPNCYGMINYLDGAALWPFAHGGTCPGWGAAIITQSGMLSSDITMAQRSLPLTHMISGGNQSVLTIEDFIDHLADHPAVRAIGVHIEGLRDVRSFEAACLKALDRGVPVVALKTGSSRIGARLTVSHTGSLSGADDLHNALFDRSGVIRVKNPSELLETLKFICVSGAPAGPRVAGFTCSGGGATMLADHAEIIGLDFPAFDAPAQAELAGMLPPIATVSNPLDYTTPIWGQPGITGPVFERAIALAKADAAVLVQDYPAAGLDESKVYYLNDAFAFCAAARRHGIPAAICATLPENLDAETRDMLIARAVAPMQGIDETLNAIAAAARWSAMRARLSADRPQPLLPAVPRNDVRMIEEAEGKQWLSALGLAVPEGRVVAGEAAPIAAAEVGFPVVLKMMGPRLAHKSEAGAVAVGLVDAAGVARAVADMRAAVAARDPAALTDRFLVEEMAERPVAELILSVRSDPQFGLALTLGSGGVLAELIGDSATLLLPATAFEVESALRGLKVAHLLGGYRGAKAVDIAGLAARIAGFAEAVAARADVLAEVEINPLFVYDKGGVAVDVLIHEWAAT